MRHSYARFLAACALTAAVALLPAAAHAQATVCKDGTTSAAKGRGACGQHGGVDPVATKSARDAALQARRAAAAAKKMVTCTDGTTATRGRGACSGHGGVQKAAGARTDAATEHHAENRAENRNENRADDQTANRAPRTEHERSRTGSSTSAAGSGAAEDNNAAGAIAQCKDGLYSHAKSRRGACSRHGGVKQWIGG